MMLTDPKPSILRKGNSLLVDHGGLFTQASTTVWTTTTLTSWEKRLAALIRSQRLWTTARKVKCRRADGNEQPADATCPYCLQGVDDAYHALNSCCAEHAQQARNLRHDNAVCKIANAASLGGNAARLLVWDARGANRPPRQPGSTKLPPWILPHNEQHSIPDICQVSVSRNYQGPNLSIDAKRTGVIAIVEIKYAPDPDLNGTVRQLAVDQHTELRQSLLTHGWGKVDIYPVIIGNAGTITATADDALQALGVGTAARMTLLKSLAMDSVRRTAEIWKPRLSRSPGRPPLHVSPPSPAPDTDAPGPSNPPATTASPGAGGHHSDATRQEEVTPLIQPLNSSGSPPSNTDCIVHPQQQQRNGTPIDTNAARQIVTRSRARASSAANGPASTQVTNTLLHRQERPSKRRLNRFAVLDNDGDQLDPQTSGDDNVYAHHNQPAVMEGTSTPDPGPELPDQDDPPVVISCINPMSHAHLTTSAIGLTDTHDDADAPQQSLPPNNADIYVFSQHRRSRRLQAAVSSQQNGATVISNTDT